MNRKQFAVLIAIFASMSLIQPLIWLVGSRLDVICNDHMIALIFVCVSYLAAHLVSLWLMRRRGLLASCMAEVPVVAGSMLAYHLCSIYVHDPLFGIAVASVCVRQIGFVFAALWIYLLALAHA